MSSEVEPAITEMHPIEQITWNEANELLPYCEIHIYTYSQREYAARAGTDTPWWTEGNPTALHRHVNLTDTSLLRSRGIPSKNRDAIDDGYPYHAPVGRLGANALGLFDIAGSISEWCIDSFSEYNRGTAEGTGLRDAIGNDRKITRGGSWETAPESARSAFR